MEKTERRWKRLDILQPLRCFYKSSNNSSASAVDMPARPVGPLGDLVGDFPLLLFLDLSWSYRGGIASVETTGFEVLGLLVNKGNSSVAACELFAINKDIVQADNSMIFFILFSPIKFIYLYFYLFIINCFLGFFNGL